MVPLLPVTPAIGGLVVIPDSHHGPIKDKLLAECTQLKNCGDWCPLPSTRYGRGDELLLEAQPGDLILWDSRTVHGGRVGYGDFDAPEWKEDLVRLSVTVSMTARARASEECLRLRRKGFEEGRCFNHTPHEAGTSSGTVHAPIDPTYVPSMLTPEQEVLLDGRITMTSATLAAAESILPTHNSGGGSAKTDKK